MEIKIDRDVRRLTRQLQRGVFREHEITVFGFVLYASEIIGLVRVVRDASKPNGLSFRAVGPMLRVRAPLSTWIAFHTIGRLVLVWRTVRSRWRRGRR